MAQRQHIVPEFLLNGFSNPTSGQIYCFDKQTGKTYLTTPEKAAKENGFYDFSLPDGSKGTLEDALEHLETQTAPVIKKIIEQERLDHLNEDERVAIALFTCIQMHRDKNSRETSATLTAIRQNTCDLRKRKSDFRH